METGFSPFFPVSTPTTSRIYTRIYIKGWRFGEQEMTLTFMQRVLLLIGSLGLSFIGLMIILV